MPRSPARCSPSSTARNSKRAARRRSRSPRPSGKQRGDARVGALGALAIAKAWTTKAVIALAAASFVVGAVAGVAGTKVISRPRRVAVPSVDAGVLASGDAGLSPPTPAPSSSPAATPPTETASAPPIVTSMRAPTPAPSARPDSSPSTLAREELAIRALRAAGRTDEARARAKAFLRAYPSSIYSATVEEAAR